MTAIKIFGIGSPQGADQIGWQAIEHLKRDRALQDLSSDRPTRLGATGLS
jgi:hypothetical protein